MAFAFPKGTLEDTTEAHLDDDALTSINAKTYGKPQKMRAS